MFVNQRWPLISVVTVKIEFDPYDWIFYTVIEAKMYEVQFIGT